MTWYLVAFDAFYAVIAFPIPIAHSGRVIFPFLLHIGWWYSFVGIVIVASDTVAVAADCLNFAGWVAPVWQVGDSTLGVVH